MWGRARRNQPDVLVAMNPAALKVNVGDLKPGGLVLADRDAFDEGSLKKAGYAANPYDPTNHEVMTRFGKNRDRGVKLWPSGRLEVVTLGSGVSEADILVHDETNRALAYTLAHLTDPTPIGVFHAEIRPTYEEATAKQAEAARQKLGAGDLNQLFLRGETWVVE